MILELNFTEAYVLKNCIESELKTLSKSTGNPHIDKWAFENYISVLNKLLEKVKNEN